MGGGSPNGKQDLKWKGEPLGDAPGYRAHLPGAGVDNNNNDVPRVVLKRRPDRILPWFRAPRSTQEVGNSGGHLYKGVSTDGRDRHSPKPWASDGLANAQSPFHGSGYRPPHSSSGSSATLVQLDRPVSGPSPQNASNLRVLHLFAGPPGREDGLAAELQKLGISCYDVDVLSGTDLLDAVVWNRIMHDVKAGKYDFVFAGPPCNTFSRARNNPGGPPPIRSSKYPYGLPHLKPEQKEYIRKHNLLACRTAEACRAIWDRGGGYAIENPAHINSDDPAIWLLHEYKELVKYSSAQWVAFDQCRYNALSTKPTWILFARADFTTLARRCNHPFQSYRDRGGNKYRSPHPKVPGQWDTAADGTAVRRSKTLAAYPAELNIALAGCIATCVVQKPALVQSNQGGQTQVWQ